MEQTKGFFQSLFDFSFTVFITAKIIKVLYGLSVAGAALVGLFLIISGFNISASAGVVMLLIGAPLFFLLSVIYTRVLLEIMIMIFRIEEHTREIAHQGQGQSEHTSNG
jgi:ABC-type multidrug transport system fused ATPase/permease subunit